jgi:tetratricopeptide (TPR) repeat protein
VSAGEFPRAELTLRRAIEINPLHQEAWARLGALYAHLGRWQDAVDALEQACALDLQDYDSAVAYAEALIATQDLQTATQVSASLLNRFPGRSGPHLIEGHLHKIQGQVSHALRSYQRALEFDPEQSEVLFNVAELRPADSSLPLLERLTQLRQRPSLSPRQTANVCFALARIHEASGDVESTFAALNEGNRAASAMMRELGEVYSPEDVERETTELIQTFTADLFPSQLESPDLDTRMVFIVGMPRSGTTLVERILSRHPRVTSAGELPFMEECLERLLDIRRSQGHRGRLQVPAQRQVLLGLREHYLDSCLNGTRIGSSSSTSCLRTFARSA